MKRIRISNETPDYMEYEDGTPFIPVGVNLCFVRNSENRTETEVLQKYAEWFEKFAAAGGNYARIWLGAPFFDVMEREAGVFEPRKLEHIRFLIRKAEQLGIYLKFTLEHFRHIGEKSEIESFPGVANFDKPIYIGICRDMADYLDNAPGQTAYLEKAKYLAENGIGDSPAVAVIELWNEVNCIAPNQRWKRWSELMIPRLKELFPRQMVVQSVGNFSGPEAYKMYDTLAELKQNDFLQAHRYLGFGAQLEVCEGPVDVLAADAIQELKRREADKPVILAEVGACDGDSYSHLYEKDIGGMLLHDMIFAPFFAGGAGCGQPWHWDHIYIEKHQLYWHFQRFCHAVNGIDPVKEHFHPFFTATDHVRVYGLEGKSCTLLWCRDKKNNWETELENGIVPTTISQEALPREISGEADAYLPWEDKWIHLSPIDGVIKLPDFKRSIVVKINTETGNH